jgi:hypothetical protein
MTEPYKVGILLNLSEDDVLLLKQLAEEINLSVPNFLAHMLRGLNAVPKKKIKVAGIDVSFSMASILFELSKQPDFFLETMCDERDFPRSLSPKKYPLSDSFPYYISPRKSPSRYWVHKIQDCNTRGLLLAKNPPGGIGSSVTEY